MMHPNWPDRILYLSGPDLPAWDKRNNWLFFDFRRTPLDRLVQALRNPVIKHIFLIGPSKIGKTSTINYIASQIHDLELTIIKVDQTDGNVLVQQILAWFSKYAQEQTIANQANTSVWQLLVKIANALYGRTEDADSVLQELQALKGQNSSFYRKMFDNRSTNEDKLQYAWLYLARCVGRSDLLEYLKDALEEAKQTQIQLCLENFSRCLKICSDTVNTQHVLVFWQNRNYRVTSDLDTFPQLDIFPQLDENICFQIKHLYEGREEYEGPSQEEEYEGPSQTSCSSSSSGSGFEGKQLKTTIQRNKQTKKIELHAFSRDDAMRFIQPDDIRQPFSDIPQPIPCRNQIPDQVGYHPALLQSVYWGMLNENCSAIKNICTPDVSQCSDCWERRLEEIKPLVSELLDEEEKRVILNPDRGIDLKIYQRLKGKGVML